MNNDLISRSALKKALEVTQYNDIDDLTRTERLIDNAQTVEPYQGEECVNIKMSDEEIKQFKQMLQEHTPLYTNTFVIDWNAILEAMQEAQNNESDNNNSDNLRNIGDDLIHQQREAFQKAIMEAMGTLTKGFKELQEAVNDAIQKLSEEE